MPNVVGLLEVEPVYGDTVETANYRTCDLCLEVPIFDNHPVRALYYDPVEGLYVCEHCTAEYLTEKHGWE